MALIFTLVSGLALLSYANRVIVPFADGDKCDADDHTFGEEFTRGMQRKSTRGKLIRELTVKSKVAADQMMDSLTLLYDTAGVKVMLLSYIISLKCSIPFAFTKH